jgi:NDP-sugar pyrophosphorylase family protein
LTYNVVVLAGGYGSRLKTISGNIPKILTKIANKKFIYWLEDNLKRLKFNKVYYIVSDASHLYDHVGIYDPELDKNILTDGKKRYGTGGAIINNLNQLPDYFWIMYGDTLLNWDLNESENYFNSKNKNMMMTIINKDLGADTPNVNVKGDLVIKYSKHKDFKYEFIDYGAILVNKNIFKNFKKNEEIDLSTVINQQIQNKECLYYETNYSFYEMGTIESYNYLSKILLIKKKVGKLWEI